MIELVKDTDKDKWITVKGTHIKLEKGESVESGIARAKKRWQDPKRAALEHAKKKGKEGMPLTKTEQKAKEKRDKELEKQRKQQTNQPKTTAQWKERARALKQALAHCRKHGDMTPTNSMKILNIELKQLKSSMNKARKEGRNNDLHLISHEIDRKQNQLSVLSLHKTGLDLIPAVSLKKDLIFTPVITQFLRIDVISFSEFKQIKTDFENSDFVIFHGPIARDGPYDYIDENGNVKTLYKDIDNLKDIYSKYNYLPMKTSEENPAHFAEEYGYATNFSVNEETNEIEADLILVNDDNFKKILSMKDKYHVSPGYNDIVTGNIQMLTDVDHIALALGDEIGRACTGTNSKGASCTIVEKTHDQNLTEVISN